MSSCSWSAYPAGSAVGSKTGPPQINCSMLTHFKGKICFQDAVRGCGICHLMTTPTLGKRTQNPTSSQREAFYSRLEVKIQPSLWWAAVGEETQWSTSLTPPLSLQQFPLSCMLSCTGWVCLGRGVTVDISANYAYKATYCQTLLRSGRRNLFQGTMSHSVAVQQPAHQKTARTEWQPAGEAAVQHRLRITEALPHAHSCSVELDSDPTTVAVLFSAVFETLHFFLNHFCDSLSKDRLFWGIPRLKLHSKGLL